MSAQPVYNDITPLQDRLFYIVGEYARCSLNAIKLIS